MPGKSTEVRPSLGNLIADLIDAMNDQRSSVDEDALASNDDRVRAIVQKIDDFFVSRPPTP